jgi:hypothetical protein
MQPISLGKEPKVVHTLTEFPPEIKKTLDEKFFLIENFSLLPSNTYPGSDTVDNNSLTIKHYKKAFAIFQ